MKVLKGHAGRVGDIAFSPDGRLLASCGKDCTFRLWDTHTGEGSVLTELPRTAFAGFERVAFTADGRHLLTRALQDGVAVWDVTGPYRVRVLLRTSSAIYRGGLAARGDWVVASEWLPDPDSNVLRLWNTLDWAESVLYQTSETCDLSGLAFDPSGARLATQVGVFDVCSGDRVIESHFPSGGRLEWSPRKPLIAVTGYGSEVTVHDAQTAEYVVTLEPGKKDVQGFAFSADGAYLVVVSNEEVVRIWDTRDWTERPGLAWGIGQLTSITFAPDGQRAACGSNRGTILIWDWDL